MTKLVALPGRGGADGLNWWATGALFEDAVRFVMERVHDPRVTEDLTGQAASGHLFLAELPEPALSDVLTALRDDFPAYVDTEIYPPAVVRRMDCADVFVARAKALADLAGRSLALRTSSDPAAAARSGPTTLSARALPGTPLAGRLVWLRDGDVAFLSEDRAAPLARAGGLGSTALTMGAVHIAVGVTTGQLLYVRGFVPRSTWRPVSLPAPAAKPGTVHVTPDSPFLPGVPFALGPGEDWRTEHDERSGWLRVAAMPGNAAAEPTETVTTIAEHTGIGLRAGRISSVWLRVGA